MIEQGRALLQEELARLAAELTRKDEDIARLQREKQFALDVLKESGDRLGDVVLGLQAKITELEKALRDALENHDEPRRIVKIIRAALAASEGKG